MPSRCSAFGTIVAGTLTQLGTFTFTIQAVAPDGATATGPYSMTVGPPLPLTITSGSTLTPGTVAPGARATIVAARAGEMIHEPALAIRASLFTGGLAQAVLAYPPGRWPSSRPPPSSSAVTAAAPPAR
jgi:hypothetical protein